MRVQISGSKGSDGALADTEIVAITVDHVNLAPELAGIGPQGVAEGGNLNFVVTASDFDGDSLILSAENLPANATFDDNFDDTTSSSDSWVGGAVPGTLGGDGLHGEFDVSVGRLVTPGVYEWSTDNQPIPKNRTLSGEDEIVTDGVFRRMRHPMYGGHLLWALGQPLLLHNLVGGLGFLTAQAMPHLWRVPREEQMLIEHFGDAYRQYMECTGRLVPRL